MEYIPTVPPLSSYVINICLYENIDDICLKRRNLEPKKWNILQWGKNDFKNMVHTNGDYLKFAWSESKANKGFNPYLLKDPWLG